MPYWSLSQYLKHKVKGAVSFISTYEKVMVTQTKRKGATGSFADIFIRLKFATLMAFFMPMMEIG